jgi:hypothetical protein
MLIIVINKMNSYKLYFYLKHMFQTCLKGYKKSLIS